MWLCCLGYNIFCMPRAAWDYFCLPTHISCKLIAALQRLLLGSRRAQPARPALAPALQRSNICGRAQTLVSGGTPCATIIMENVELQLMCWGLRAQACRPLWGSWFQFSRPAPSRQQHRMPALALSVDPCAMQGADDVMEERIEHPDIGGYAS